MRLTVHRGPPLWQESRNMPAATYNLARTLQMRSPGGVAFVAIRSLQVLAIIDAEEFVFVDAEEKAWALLSWEHMRPDHRDALDQPVEFEAIGYGPLAQDVMRRLPREFHEALQALAERQRHDEPAQLLPFRSRRKQE